MLAAYKIKIDWSVLLLVLLKNIPEPSLVLGSLLWLGHGDPVVPEAVPTTAIPVCRSRSTVEQGSNSQRRDEMNRVAKSCAEHAVASVRNSQISDIENSEQRLAPEISARAAS
jgi:hypothetical protein